MCFSAESGLAAGVTLVPAGAYCVSAALRKDRSYLQLAAVPLIFGIQQLCEAAVWRGLHRGDAGLVEAGALAFLFFALALWPAWVPYGAAVLERRPPKRRRPFALAAVGLVIGCAAYVPAVAGYGEWLRVGIAGHSIRYDLTGLAGIDSAAGAIWFVLYLAAVCLPLAVARDRRLRGLGLSVALAAGVTEAMARYAFVSMWCFSAA